MPRRTLYKGNRYGSLVVIDRVDDGINDNGRKRARYLCQCDCGNTKIVYGENLTGGKTLSCGCLRNRRVEEACMTHGDADSRLYKVWCAMKSRCDNKNVKAYHNYGGRGIRVCDEWHDNYAAFKAWAFLNGYDPNAPHGECTIDRIDIDGDYSPDNCRWADAKTQMNNVRYNYVVEYEGRKFTLAELAREYNVPYQRIKQRITLYGWSVDDAINKPPRKIRK